MKEYREDLARVFDNPSVDDFFVGDASPTNLFKRVLGRLDRRWRGIFSEFAKRHVNYFVEKVDDYSKFSTNHSLKNLGLDDPKDAKTQKMAETMKAAVQENVALITNIQEDFAKSIEGAVFRSLGTTNPSEAVGSDEVMRELMHKGGMSKQRAQLIAEDQNSKLYSALNAERMNQNGVEKFRWRHSSAGKYPRASHIAREKQDVGYGPGIFRLDSPELWEGPQADKGLPGEAIRCRCRMIPIIEF